MFKRTAHTPDTFGMASSTARRTKARAAGRTAAETGRHRGGPCPAVALATLSGWSYARAERFLKDHGFAGDGMSRPAIMDAFTRLFGRPSYVASLEHDRMSCGAAVDRFARRQDGIAFCRGHVMPIRNGRLLNASTRHRRMTCESLVLWNIEEVPA